MSADAVVCAHSGGDWWALERESGRRLAWASIEGTGEEMRALAAGILAGEATRAKRCAASPVNGGWEVWSPRNHASDTYPRITSAEARSLAEQILRDVPVEPPRTEDGA